MLLKKGDSQVPRIDIEGWFLLILAVTVPLVAVTLGDNILDWTHPVEILLLICGPVLMTCFVVFEARAAAAPILNMVPILKIGYIRVICQVFGVISVLNSVKSNFFENGRKTHHNDRSFSLYRRIFKFAPSMDRPLKTGR